MSIFSLNILRSNRAGGFYLSTTPPPNPECFANAFSHFPGHYFQEENTENWEWEASQGSCVWEAGKPLIRPVGFQKAVGMRKERSKAAA